MSNSNKETLSSDSPEEGGVDRGEGGREGGVGQLIFMPVTVWQILPGPFTSRGWCHNNQASVFCFATFGRSCAVIRRAGRSIFSLERDMVYD